MKNTTKSTEVGFALLMGESELTQLARIVEQGAGLPEISAQLSDNSDVTFDGLSELFEFSNSSARAIESVRLAHTYSSVAHHSQLGEMIVFLKLGARSSFSPSASYDLEGPDEAVAQMSAKLDETIRECKAPLFWLLSLGKPSNVIMLWVTTVIMWIAIRQSIPAEEMSDITSSLASVWSLLVVVVGTRVVTEWVPAWCSPRICFATGIFGKKRAETYAKRRNVGLVGIVASAILGVVLSKVLG